MIKSKGSVTIILTAIFIVLILAIGGFLLLKPDSDKDIQVKEGIEEPEGIDDIEKVDNQMISQEKIEEFIPDGWKLLKKAEGDLNNDGLPDTVIVNQEILELESEFESFKFAPRKLLVLFQEQDGSLKLILESEKAILLATEGGVFGDPFENISINDNLLEIKFYGGSNSRWEDIFKFKLNLHDYDENIWIELIYAKLTDYHTSTGEGEIKTYDFLTHKMKSEFGYVAIEGSQLAEKEYDLVKTKGLLRLKDFDPRKISDYLTELEI